MDVPATTIIDPDGQNVTLSARLPGGELPTWLSFDPAKGFSGVSPTQQDLQISVVGTNAHGQASTDFQLHVGSGNVAAPAPKSVASPSVILRLDDVMAPVGTRFQHTLPQIELVHEDGTSDGFRYTASLEGGGGLPDWLSFHADRMSITGIPPSKGESWIVVKGTNGDRAAGVMLRLTAVDAPQNGDVPSVLAEVGKPLHHALPSNAIVDPTGGDLSFSASLADGEDLPQWLHFDPKQKTFSGTPPKAEQLKISVSGKDAQGLSASTEFSLNADQSPLIANPLPNVDAEVGELLHHVLPSNAIVDPDGDDLSFSASLADGEDLPPWLHFDPKQMRFSGFPPKQEELQISVSGKDPQGLSAETGFSLVVKPPVGPAVLKQLPDVTAQFGKPLHDTIPSDAIVDPNGGDLSFSASLADGEALPPWLHFDPEQKTFSGTPPEEEQLQISVSAKDKEGLSASTGFSLGVGRSPIAKPLSDVQAEVGKPLHHAVPSNTIVDPDGGDLSFTASLEDGEVLPQWLHFDPEQNIFSGIPPKEEQLQISVSGTDPQGLSAATGFSLTAGKLPVVTGRLPAINGKIGKKLHHNIPIAIVDPDGGDLAYSASLDGGEALPDWLQFDPEQMTFSGTPSGEGDWTVALKGVSAQGFSSSALMDVHVGGGPTDQMATQLQGSRQGA